MTSEPLLQVTFISRRPGVADVADIIKFAIMLIETTCKDSMKVKIIRKNVSKYNFCLYFLI